MTTTSKHPTKRTAIINSALHLFAEKGIKGTTVRDIAQEADVTEGALYRHYAGKKQLAASIFAECARLFYGHLDQALEGVSEPPQRLARLIQAFFDFAANQPEAYEYVMARHHEVLPVLPPEHPKPKDVIAFVIEQGMDTGDFRQMDRELATSMIVGLCIRPLFFLDHGMLHSSREEVISEVTRAALSILDAGPRASAEGAGAARPAVL